MISIEKILIERALETIAPSSLQDSVNNAVKEFIEGEDFADAIAESLRDDYMYDIAGEIAQAIAPKLQDAITKL